MNNEQLIAYVKKVPTNQGLEWLFEFSKTIFKDYNKPNKMNGIYEFDTSNGIQKMHHMVGAWNINYIIYYLIKYSNDERALKTKIPLTEYMLFLLAYFQSHDDDNDVMSKYDKYGAMEVLEGIGNEQFKFQLTYNYFNDINRLIYLFVKSNYSSTITNTINSLTQNLFSCDIKVFLLSIAYIFAEYLKDSVFEKFIDIESFKFKNVGFDTTIINRIIKYYSISYLDVRESPDNQLVFYNKPFIKNKKGNTICSSIYNVYFLFGDSLYRLIAEYYRDKKDDTFFSKFGNVFEKYFYDLFIDNGLKRYIKKIDEDSINESPDFILEINNKAIIFECKSIVSRISSTQRDPNMRDLFYFYSHIKKGHNQINSYIKNNRIEKQILKVVVEYTHERDEGLLKTNSKINDENFIIMNIVHIESICLLYKNDISAFNNLFDKLFDTEYLKSMSYSMLKIFIDLKIPFNNYYQDDKNYIIDFVKSLMPNIT